MDLTTDNLQHLWFGAVDDPAVQAPASEGLLGMIEKAAELKAFPVAAQRALAILSKPEHSRSALAETIEGDPGISARLLKLANTSLYARRFPSESVYDAIARLGTASVTSAVSAAALGQLFSTADGEAAALRDHCVGTAAVARMMARAYAPEQAEMVFLAGLMHEIGKLLLLEAGVEVAPQSVLSPDKDAKAERASLGYDHAVLGGNVVRGWHLPPPVPKMVALHHDPKRGMDDPEILDAMAILRLADRLEPVMSQGVPSYKLEAVAKRLVSDRASRISGIQAGYLVKAWGRLSEARVEALAALK